MAEPAPKLQTATGGGGPPLRPRRANRRPPVVIGIIVWPDGRIARRATLAHLSRSLSRMDAEARERAADGA